MSVVGPVSTVRGAATSRQLLGGIANVLRASRNRRVTLADLPVHRVDVCFKGQADTSLASLSSTERRLLQRVALRLRHLLDAERLVIRARHQPHVLLVAAVDADALVQEPQQ